LLNSDSNSTITRQQVHRWLFITALSFLCIGLPNSTVFMSIGQLVLGLNWIAEGNFSIKWKRFITNRAALVLCSFYIMHLIGLAYTQDFDYGMEDIRKKVPLLILPFLFSTVEPFTTKERNIVLGLFIGGVTFTTFHGTIRLLRHAFADIHDIAPHVSSIRLSLMIVLSIFLLIGYVFSQKWSPLSVLFVVWAVWLFCFLIIMESLTGVLLTIFLFAGLLVYYSVMRIRKGKWVQGAGILLVIVALFATPTLYVLHFKAKYFPKPDEINFARTDRFSKLGDIYITDTTSRLTENGHFVYAYVAWNELKRNWNKRSKIPYDSLDRKGNRICYTIMRYMSSMDLRKDSTGLSKLSAGDISAIENGVPNYKFMALSSMQMRLYQALWEIQDFGRGGNVSGHSIMQRLEFWRAAEGIIKQHWLIGVGTGDVKNAFAQQYDAMHTNLEKPFRLRSHNQYLEIAVGFGITGLLWFLFSLFYPAIKMHKLKSYTYIIFFLIIFFSMFSEDTLETQAGATFYALFNSLFLFLA